MTIRLPDDCREVLEFQHGVLARRQASDCGLCRRSIDNLLRTGRWQHLYFSVYAAFTGRPSRESVHWAALLRCGPRAVLSHYTAAELDGIRGRRTEAIHVTIPAKERVRFLQHEFSGELPRIVLHRSTRAEIAGHPARTPPRTRVEETVLDLVELAPDFQAAFSWLSAACGGRHTTPDHLRAAVASRPKVRWRADVLAALDELQDGVRSLLERRYVRNVERAHGLPGANRQSRKRRRSGSIYLDNEYPDYGVVVELDGLAYHLVEDRWQDIHRDNYLAQSDIVVLRYNWADVITRPCEVAAEIASVLRQRGWTGRVRSCGASCRAAHA